MVIAGFNGRNLVVDALFLDREKALWIGTSAEGLYRVHDGTVDHFPRPQMALRVKLYMVSMRTMKEMCGP